MSRIPRTREIRAEYEYGWADPEHYVFKSGRGLSHELVDAISHHKSEPEWMREFRHRALDDFLARPMPAERMTFVDVSRPIGNLNVYHSEAYLRRHWSSYFEIVSLPRKMHGFHQDAALLRKA